MARKKKQGLMESIEERLKYLLEKSDPEGKKGKIDAVEFSQHKQIIDTALKFISVKNKIEDDEEGEFFKNKLSEEEQIDDKALAANDSRRHGRGGGEGDGDGEDFTERSFPWEDPED